MRIGTSIGVFQQRLLNQLFFVNRAVEVSSLRLATGKRINSAADDPSGIVALSSLKSDQAAVQQSTKNIERAKSLVDTADLALGQVATQLTTIRTLALEAAGGTLTQDELEANQVEIDAAIEAINGLTRTSFDGKRLLDGSQDFATTGVNTSQVEQLTVLDRNTNATTQTIDVNVTIDAERAQLTYAGDPGALITDDATLTLTGSLGATTITVTQAESLTDVQDRINLDSGLTGIVASINGDDLILTSSELGNNATIAVQVTSGTFAVTGGNGDGTANGVDAEATINGNTVTADGLKFRFRSKSLDFDIEVEESFTTGALDTITVSGNALAFQLSPYGGQLATLSISSVHAARIGGASGSLSEIATGRGKSLLDDPSTAVAIADQALAQISFQQARVGVFSSIILDTAETTLINEDTSLTAAISFIEDADGALETALLVQNQLLSDNIASALAISTTQNANVIGLLQQVALSI